MTQAQFIKSKISAHVPQFKELMMLSKDDNNASELLEFMRFNHNGKYTCLEAQGSQGKVESVKGSYIYTMFNTHILKKDIYRGTQTLYTR